MKRKMFAIRITLWCLLAIIFPVNAGAQCQDPKSGPGIPACGDVPGTWYTLDKVNWLINDAAKAVPFCNRESGWAECNNVDRLLYDADVAIDQMRRYGRAQSHTSSSAKTQTLRWYGIQPLWLQLDGY